jgi:hypothetical protein
MNKLKEEKKILQDTANFCVILDMCEDSDPNETETERDSRLKWNKTCREMDSQLFDQIREIQSELDRPKWSWTLSSKKQAEQKQNYPTHTTLGDFLRSSQKRQRRY